MVNRREFLQLGSIAAVLPLLPDIASAAIDPPVAAPQLLTMTAPVMPHVWEVTKYTMSCHIKGDFTIGQLLEHYDTVAILGDKYFRVSKFVNATLGSRVQFSFPMPHTPGVLITNSGVFPGGFVQEHYQSVSKHQTIHHKINKPAWALAEVRPAPFVKKFSMPATSVGN